MQWQPSNLAPGLTAADVQDVTVTHPLPARAALQDAAGAAIFGPTDVVTVGVQPSKATDLPALAAKLAAVLEVDAAEIVADVKKAKPDAFVTVVTLRKPDYLKVKAQIYDLPGTVFQSSVQQLAPTRTFAQPLLGRVGAATKEVLKDLGPGYDATAQVGVSGLQRTLNTTLVGKPGLTIKAGDTVLTAQTGTPGTPVPTTLDRSVQTAADAAVATVPQAAALVAIRPSTGAILAVSDNAQAGFELGLGGKFPAGSTFKIVTSTALLDAKVVQLTSTVACPGTVVVYGKEFENEDKFDLGQVPLRTAFAKSCNTTFTGLSQKLDDGALPAAAKDYGVGTKWNLTAPSFGGSVPAPQGRHREGRDRDRPGPGRGQRADHGPDLGPGAEGRPGAAAADPGGRGGRDGTGRAAGRGAAGAAGHDAGGGHRRHGQAPRRRARRAGVGQDRHGRVRHEGAAGPRTPGSPGSRATWPSPCSSRTASRPGPPPCRWRRRS